MRSPDQGLDRPRQEVPSRERPGDLSNAALTPDLATFCQSGVSIVAASRDGTGRPVVGRAVGCTINSEARVRILVRRSSNARLFQAVEERAPLAVTFTRPTTHRSIQLKAAGAQMAGLAPEDVAAAASQAAALRSELIEDGYTATFATGYCAFAADDLAALDFIPSEAFEQTPGPKAGTPLPQP